MSSCSGHPTTVVAMLDAAMAANAVRPALHYQGGAVTYGAFAERVRRAAGLLAAQGVGPGDRVALWLPNTPAYIELFFACARLGAIAVAALLYVWFITLFQYAVPTLLVMMFTVHYFGSRGALRMVLIPVVAVCIYYLVFFVIFGLYEEPGILLSYDSYSFAKTVRDAIGLR